MRATWARNRTNVFFLLASMGSRPTRQLQQEMEQHNDVFWIQGPEEYLKVTWKVQAFFHAVHTLVGSYRQIIKTDDDSYLRLQAIERAGTKAGNKGEEATLAVIEMVNTLRRVE